jgi:hypothetical protein
MGGQETEATVQVAGARRKAALLRGSAGAAPRTVRRKELATRPNPDASPGDNVGFSTASLVHAHRPRGHRGATFAREPTAAFEAASA